VPVITRKKAGNDDGTVEILAGHNRINAAKIAGMESIPAVVLEDISDEEAMVYVVETNLIQRSFGDMTHSEKAAVIAMHHNKMFSQGKRNDIMEQLKALENPDAVKAETSEQSTDSTSDTAENLTSSQNGTKLEDGADTPADGDTGQRTTEKIGALYSLSRNTIARYLRINQLNAPLKLMLDNGKILSGVAVELSFLTAQEQEWLAECLEGGFSVNNVKANLLRKGSSEGKLDMDTMTNILIGQPAATSAETKPQRIKVSGELYSRYFKPDQSKKEVEVIVEEALKQYFERVGGGAN
jgi:ParB family chromosome partitioning protein